MVSVWHWRFRMISLLGGSLTLLLGLGLISPFRANAADWLTFKMGSLQSSIKVDDLQEFADTGEISPSLAQHRWVLTPQMQNLLRQRLEIDPVIANRFLTQLEASWEGEQLLKQLQGAFPKSSRNQLEAALRYTWEKQQELNIIAFLRTYPAKTLTIDLAAASQMAVQFNASSWQSQLLRPHLKTALTVKNPSSPPLSFDPTASGNQIVYFENLRFQDHERNRRIVVDIYYSNDTRGPLVVMSHGFAADRKFAVYLARHLASYGFTVVSVEHPGSNIDALVETALGIQINDILPASEFVNRPQDISFVLDRLHRLNRRPTHLRGKFNTQQVTMIGHSFGGYTALALAGGSLNFKQLRQFCQSLSPLGRSPADWLQCAGAKLPYRQKNLRDRRIAQVIAFNPIVGHLFDNLSDITIPTLILAATDDGITPTIPHHLRPFQQLSGEKYLMVAVGATHMSVTDIVNVNSAVGQSTLVREVMGIEADPVREGAKALSLAFIEQLTPNATRFKPILTPDYLPQLSSADIQLSLTTDLSVVLQGWLTVLTLGVEKITVNPPQSQQPLVYRFTHYIAKFRHLLPQTEYCTRPLDDLMTSLLNNYSPPTKPLS